MLQITKLGVGIIDGQWSEQQLNGDSVDSRYLDISTLYLMLAKLTHGCRMPAAAGLGNWRVDSWIQYSRYIRLLPSHG